MFVFYYSLLISFLLFILCITHKPKLFEVTWAILDYSILIKKESANEKSDVFA